MAKKIEKRLKTFDAYVSMALGLAIILILGALIFNYTSKQRQTATNGTGPTGQEALSGQPGAKLPTTYTVKDGDSLWKISEAFYKSGYNWVDIQEANGLSSPGDIATGNSLTIPDVSPKQITTGDISAAQTVTPMATAAQEATTAPVLTTAPVATAVPEAAPTQAPAPSAKEYTVKTGDSLWKIAVSAYGDGYKWVEIARANSLTNPDIIHSGNVLKLP